MRQEEAEIFKSKAGLDEADYDDLSVQELLSVYDEVKHGLDTEEEEEEDEMLEDNDDADASDEEDEDEEENEGDEDQEKA